MEDDLRWVDRFNGSYFVGRHVIILCVAAYQTRVPADDLQSIQHYSHRGKKKSLSQKVARKHGM